MVRDSRLRLAPDFPINILKLVKITKRNLTMRKQGSSIPPRFSNLYQFIRLILGNKITDRRIAQRWNIDVKNFHDLKFSKHSIPRVERLLSLANVLEIDDHLVYEVAKGASAQRVYYLVKKARLKGKGNLTIAKWPKVYKIMSESERRYKKLFAHAGDAILVADIKTGNFIDCNKKAEELTGYSSDKLIGRHLSLLYPQWRHQELMKRFRRRARHVEYVKHSISNLLRKDKRFIPAHLTTNIIKLDGRPVIQGIFRDASRLKLKNQPAYGKFLDAAAPTTNP